MVPNIVSNITCVHYDENDTENTSIYFANSLKARDEILEKIKKRISIDAFRIINAKYVDFVKMGKELEEGLVISGIDINYPKVYFEKITNIPPGISMHDDVYFINLLAGIDNSIASKPIGYIYIDYDVENCFEVKAPKEKESDQLEQIKQVEDFTKRGNK